MFPENESPTAAATGFTDQFVQAGVDKLDALFGAGYAKQNPQALAAYITACATNLNAFMTAAAAIQEDDSFEEALAAYEEEMRPEPKPKSKLWRP